MNLNYLITYNFKIKKSKMKRNDLLILFATGVYSFLFYHQLLGVNLFLFNMTLIVMLIYRDISILKCTSFLASASLSIQTSFACYWHSSNFSIIMNIISLLITTAAAMNKDNSILLHIFHSIYSYITVLGYMIYDLLKNKTTETEAAKTSSVIKKIILSIIPILIAIVFFFLYRQSNIAFKNLTDKINFDFISFPWIGYTLLGFILMYAFFMQRSITFLNEKELLKGDDLFNKYDAENKDWFQTFMSFKSEYLMGIILFSIINLLTLSVNITDIIYTWSAHSLPIGVTFSEFIHSGIASLITSIVLAIFIILFYFRGAINFYSSNKIIKLLAYLWLLQNIFLVISTLLRNKMYVDTYSLTEKRVGVFIYLGLCIIGLVLCIYKIAKKKNNIFLFRKNIWAIYISLAILAVFDWSYCIAAYNIFRTKKTNNFYLDAKYMGDLNENNLAVVWDYYQILPNSDFRKVILKDILDHKMQTVLLKNANYNFQSMTYQRHILSAFISKLDQQHQIKSMNITDKSLHNLDHIKQLTHIEKLNLSNNQLVDIQVLNNFSDLKELNLSGNTLDSIKKMPSLHQLENLNISNTSSTSLAKITNYENLKTLDISVNNISNLNGIEKFQQLKELDISNNSIKNLSSLSNLPNLQKIKLSNVLTSDNEFPYITNLKSVDISNSYNNYKNVDFLIDENLLNQLNELNLNNVKLANFSFLNNLTETNQLEKLYISGTQLYNLDYLVKLSKLIELDLSNNNLTALKLQIPSSVTILNISNSKLEDYSFLAEIKSLKELNISGTNLAVIKVVQLNQLEKIDASNCQNANQLVKIQSPRLKELDIQYCNLDKEYSFMKNYKSLESLKISSIDKELGEILLSLKNLKKIECFYIDEKIYNQLIINNPNIWIIRNDQSRYSSSETSVDSF